jgi:hypothetical protein
MSAVSQGSLTATGQAVRRVLAGILTRNQVGEPTPAHIARLAVAAVILPVWIGLAAAASRLAAGIAIDEAAAIATILRLFVLQALALVPILASLRSLRSVGALGGNGALPDFALVLHLSAGIALGLDAGNSGAGAAAFALQQTVVYVTSVAMVIAAAGRGVVAASPALVAAGVLSALMPPCIVLMARAATALAMHLAGFPASVLASTRRIYGLF